MADRLSLYNGALRLCRERRLASLTEERHPRRLLDDAWGDGAQGGSVRRCLELGQWTFATRTAKIAFDPDVAPEFGHRYAFSQPDDMIRPVAICIDEYFLDPLLQYADERRFWYASIDTIYVKWVSNDPAYGGDIGAWPETFVKLVEADLANEIVFTLTEDAATRAYVEKALSDAKLEAKSRDAMNRPTVMPPQGSWNQARRGGSRTRSSYWNGEMR